jgi:hypothetical protein
MKAIVLLPVLSLLLTGCKPSDSSTASTGSSNSGSNDSVLQAPANYVNGLGRAERNAGATADVASLNQAIGSFQIDKGRFPNNLDELVQEKYLTKVPDAPFGMKIDYDASTGQVKVVKQ